MAVGKGASGKGDAKATRRSPQQVLDEIVSAAQAEFKEHGYERTTTAAIARRARVSESQMYRYFATKLDIFHEAVFHYVERNMMEFYRTGMSGNVKLPEDYAGTINETAARRILELLDFFRKNSEAIVTLLFAKAYVPNAKGLGDLQAVNSFFERGAENLLDYRSPATGKQRQADPALVLRALFLGVMANSVFRDVIYPPGIASEEAINDAVATAIIEGLSAFSA